MRLQTSHFTWTPVVVAAGATIGAFYTLSPLSILCLVWMAWVFRWTARGVTGRQRRWLLTALGAALALRAIAIGILPLFMASRQTAYASYFADGHYAIQRSIWIRNVFLGVPIAPRDYIEAFEPEFGWSGYNYILAFLHVMFGPSPYGVTFVSAALFLTASAVLYRLCRHAFGPLAALGTLIALLFLPSWLAWSVVPMREAMQLLLLTVLMAAALAVARGPWRKRIGALFLFAAVILVVATLRGGAAWMATLAVGVSGVLWLGTRRWWMCVACGALVAVVVVWAANDSRARTLVTTRMSEAALRHLGNVRMRGFAYKILDEKFYADSALPTDPLSLTMTPAEGARYLLRATVAFFIMPVPTVVEITRWLIVAPLQLEWGVLLLLSLYGLVAGARRDALLTSLLAGFVVAGVIVIAPNSGNVGTLIRHRDAITPFVAALAGIGGVAAAGRLLGAGAPPRRSADSLNVVV